MVDLTEVVYQQAKDGDTECAKGLLQHFLSNLIEAKEKFHPVIHEYAVSAIEKILAGVLDADHALLLERSGRGNKETPEKTRRALEIAEEIHYKLKKNGNNLTQAANELAQDPSNMIGAATIESIYRKWRSAIESDENFEE